MSLTLCVFCDSFKVVGIAVKSLASVKHPSPHYQYYFFFLVASSAPSFYKSSF